ncbi:MAG: prepilin-type N-terminal cleavage/methylation domain-containing protein [Phycisphaerales bacterium]
MHTRRPLRPTPSTLPSTRPAFTLVELIAVIVVLAVVAVGATLHTASISATSRLRWASNQVARDLSFARERAMSTGTTHWIRFDTTSQYYAVLADSTTTPGYASATTITDPTNQTPFVTNLNRDNWAGITIAPGGTFSSISYTIGFNQLGRPIATSGAAITASTGPTLMVSGTSPRTPYGAGASSTATVTITAATGKITY